MYLKDTLAFSIAAPKLFNANIHGFMLPKDKICIAIVGTADGNARHEAEASAPACTADGDTWHLGKDLLGITLREKVFTR